MPTRWNIYETGWPRCVEPTISERGWVMLIVLLAFALRVYRLGAQAIWWDESLSLYRATRDLSTILANTILIQNVVTHDLQPPLYFILLHFFVGAGGISEFALRFLSVMANVATVPLLFVLARRWLSPSIAILAAFLGALSPFYVWYAQEARPYALVLFLALLAIYALTRVFKGHEGRPVDLGWLAVYVCAAIASLYTNYYALFLIPFHVVLIALTVWRTARVRPFILLPALPLAGAVFLIPLAAIGANENASGGPVYVPFDVILRDLLNSFSVGITIDLAQVFWIDLALLALCLIGLVAFRRASVFLLAFLAIPLLGLAAACLRSTALSAFAVSHCAQPGILFGRRRGHCGIGAAMESDGRACARSLSDRRGAFAQQSVLRSKLRQGRSSRVGRLFARARAPRRFPDSRFAAHGSTLPLLCG